MWYEEYCRDHHIPVKYGKERERHEQKLRRAVAKASELEKVDLSGLSREEAEAKLVAKSEEMTVGMAGLSLLLFQAVIGWLVRRLLDKYFEVKK